MEGREEAVGLMDDEGLMVGGEDNVGLDEMDGTAEGNGSPQSISIIDEL